MKIQSGLIGVIGNANTRQLFFQATLEMSQLSAEFKGQLELAVDKMKAAMPSHVIPSAVQLHNTCIHIPQENVLQILNTDVTTQKLYEDYVAESINGDVSVWAPV